MPSDTTPTTYADSTLKTFASDNYSGAHPLMIDAITNANAGHAAAYGADDYSKRLGELIRERFGKNALAVLTFNGTGANVLGLSALTPRHGAVICADSAHIEQDEGNAPQLVAGLKHLCIKSADGKITPAQIKSKIEHAPHRALATTVYISQPTEFGTCYTLDELRQIRQMCDQHDLKLFIDGARLCNAAVRLGCDFADFAQYAHALSLGGTKNGLIFGECLVVMDQSLHHAMPYLQKAHLQTGSKMRFIAAQFVAWLESGIWQELASHSNQMADYLAKKIAPLAPVTQKVEANAVFVHMQDDVIQKLSHHHFYTWLPAHGDTPATVRLMCTFDTTRAQIDAFAMDLTSALAN